MGSAKEINAKPVPMENKKFNVLSSIKKKFLKNKKDDKIDKDEKKTNSKIEKQIDQPNVTVSNILNTFDKLRIKDDIDVKDNIKTQDKTQNVNIDKCTNQPKETVTNILNNFDKRIKEDNEEKSKTQNDKRINEPKDTVTNILNNLDKRINEKVETKRKESVSEEEDELDNFVYKNVEEDRVRHSSEDSGFSEAKDEGEMVKAFDKLKIEKKGKKTKQVLAPRGPMRAKLNDYNVTPYHLQTNSDYFKQINQVNQHALSGGHVLDCTPTPTTPPTQKKAISTSIEVDIALKEVEDFVQKFSNQAELLDDLFELISEETNKNNLQDFSLPTHALEADNLIAVPSLTRVEPNPIEEFFTAQNLPHTEDSIDINFLAYNQLTPSRLPPSPVSSTSSFYPNYESCTENSSPNYCSDYEKYQEIPPFEHSFSPDLSPISEGNEEKKRERTTSMTMKNFKDLQKEISNEFSKKDCCQINRKSIKEVFEECMGKLSVEERKNLSFNVAKMDIKTAHGVLHNVLLSMAASEEKEALLTSMFMLVGQRILAETAAAYIGEIGLDLIKSAALRCPHKPIFTRFIVHCVYVAFQHEITARGQDCIFHEVDPLGDNLEIACARGGDSYALVLAEITRPYTRGEDKLPTLFRMHHANGDGYTALHVACSQHSSTSPRLHTMHVLLEHANADLWKGDVKGGETALHLAVNSVNCDLRAIMMIFKQLDRKEWKKLAHHPNMSGISSLEYARSATKTATRQNYPLEVLDFLKKCR